MSLFRTEHPKKEDVIYNISDKLSQIIRSKNVILLLDYLKIVQVLMIQILNHLRILSFIIL